MSAPYRSIACCVSDDPASEAVIAEGLALRAESPGALHLVTVTAPGRTSLAGPFSYDADPPAEREARAREWLAGRAAEVPGAEVVVLEGYPPRAVCRWAERHLPELLQARARAARRAEH